MHARKQLWASTLLLLLVISPAAPASLLGQEYAASWAPSGFFPIQPQSFRIVSVKNETGHKASFDMLGYLRQQTRQQLQQQGFREAPAGAPGAVAIELRVHLYQEGSTFGRWLGGGSGAAYAVVYASFHRPGLAPANLLSVSVIAGGGLFSAGAAKTVLDDAASQIGDYLKDGASK